MVLFCEAQSTRFLLLEMRVFSTLWIYLSGDYRRPWSLTSVRPIHRAIDFEPV